MPKKDPYFYWTGQKTLKNPFGEQARKDARKGFKKLGKSIKKNYAYGKEGAEAVAKTVSNPARTGAKQGKQIKKRLGKSIKKNVAKTVSNPVRTGAKQGKQIKKRLDKAFNKWMGKN